MGPTEDLKAIEGLDLDFEVELAVIIDAVPLGVSVVDAGNYIKVLTACNDFTYRKLAASDRKSGFGFVQSKALTSFCAFGLLPSTSTEMWNGGRPILGARVTLNGEVFCEISTLDMLSSFPEIVAYCAKTRDLPAGTVITSGAISTNGQGDSCIAEKKYRLRMNCETCNVDFLQVEDVVKIEFFSLDRAGKFQSDSLFGPLENRVITR